MLYECGQFLKDDALTFCGITTQLPLKVWRPISPPASADQTSSTPTTPLPTTEVVLVVQDAIDPLALAHSLLEYDLQQLQQRFNQGYHSCDICFSEYPGSSCYQLPLCKHAFCRKCLSGFYESQITTGAVEQLKCPNGSCDATALPSDVKEVCSCVVSVFYRQNLLPFSQLVSAENFERYDRLLTERCLSQMHDVVTCARKACQAPVILEPDSHMGLCQKCKFCFCVWCGQTWHGDLRPCAINNLLTIVEEYKTADATQRAFLENKFGRQR